MVESVLKAQALKVQCLKARCCKRVLARLRSSSPLALGTMLVVLGQIFGACFFVHFVSQSILASFALLLLVFGLVLGRICLTAISLGLISVSLIVPTWSINPSWSPHTSYLVKIIESPRHRRVGQIDLVLNVLGELSHKIQSSPKLVSWDEPLKASCKAIHLPWRQLHSAEQGDVLVVRGQFSTISAKWNPFDYASTLWRQGFRADCKLIYAWKFEDPLKQPVRSLNTAIMSKVDRVLGSGERAGLLLSLALGVRDQISQDTEERFKATGLAHLLVFSGYQVNLVFVTIMLIAKSICLQLKGAFYFYHLNLILGVLGLVSVLAILLITGFEVSSVRALIAICFAACYIFSELRSNWLNNLSVSLLILSLLWPNCILEPGVQLTYAALLGIAIGSSLPSLSVVAKYLKVYIFAGLFTNYISLIWFSSVSLIGLLLNPILVPIFSVLACNLGYLALALSCLFDCDSLLSFVAAILMGLRDLVYIFASYNEQVRIAGLMKTGLIFILTGVLVYYLWQMMKSFMHSQNLAQ